MIVGFHDDATADLFHGVDSPAGRSRLPKPLWSVAQRKLDLINAAGDVIDLRIPPGNRLEKLKGNLAGKYSIRINDQYRVVFHFANGSASDVWVTDYH